MKLRQAIQQSLLQEQLLVREIAKASGIPELKKIKNLYWVGGGDYSGDLYYWDMLRVINVTETPEGHIITACGARAIYRGLQPVSIHFYFEEPLSQGEFMLQLAEGQRRRDEWMKAKTSIVFDLHPENYAAFVNSEGGNAGFCKGKNPFLIPVTPGIYSLFWVQHTCFERDDFLI